MRNNFRQIPCDLSLLQFKNELNLALIGTTVLNRVFLKLTEIGNNGNNDIISFTV